jgi:glucose/arabinose dehydrogenase
VQVLGHGVPTPTSIAAGHGTVFVGAAGYEEGSLSVPGGLFKVAGGVSQRVPGAPSSPIMGIAWHDRSLYLSAGSELLKMGGWNGKRFAHTKILYTAPAGFSGFSGIAFGPEGRIYAGVLLDQAYDHTKSYTPFAQSLVSLNANGTGIRVVASGLRQPFQLTFVNGSKHPLISAIGQDNLGESEPPDYIASAVAGQNYGFPTCNWSAPSACAPYATPLELLPAHATPMGIGANGDTVYIALYTGIEGNPASSRCLPPAAR